MVIRINTFNLITVPWLTIFLLIIHINIYSQTTILKGIVKDEQSRKPIQEVNVRIAGTTEGAASDKSGTFSLVLGKIPATLVLTCIGYEDTYFEVIDFPQKPLEFLLTAKSYSLQQVDISEKKYSFLFQDKNYSVLDYELLGDNVLLLTFRYQLKRSDLILLNRSGDTLSISKLPEVPPGYLYKDFLANVHYFSKSNSAYQCFFNENQKSIDFLDKIAVDSLLNLVRSFIFKISDRLYFQEALANGFGTAIGYYEKGAIKKYIRKYVSEKRISEYLDDQLFYAKWNAFIGPVLTDAEVKSTDYAKGPKDGQLISMHEERAHQFEFYNTVYPVIRTEENDIAFFNFPGDRVEFMNENGKIINTVPITFHKNSKSGNDSNSLSNSGWRWGNTILVDSYNRHVYTTFVRNGMIKLERIDLGTGKLNQGTVLPYPFPVKIEIYKGEAFFLVKSDGSNDKWKLVKCRL